MTTSAVNGLVARLTHPEDRETYATLVSYVNSLPPGDELIRVMEMFGLLAAVAQRVPDALGEFLQELRAQTSAAKQYHAQVDARLAGLPSEIAAGVDVAGVVRAMSESFRQQLASTGLQDTAALLKIETGLIKSLTAELASTLKPAAGEYRGIASALAAETAKLAKMAREVGELNHRLIIRRRSDSWTMRALAALLIFLLGGLAGMIVEKRHTVDALANIGASK